MGERSTPAKPVAPKLRKAPKTTRTSWSVKKRNVFLAHLAISCNVAASCRKARLYESLVYRRRRIDAAFRASWAEAVTEAVQRLEMALLERAMAGKVVERTRGGETVKTVEYSDQVAMALIRAHKDGAIPVGDDDEEELAALRAKISRKLDFVARREAARLAKAIGTVEFPAGQAPVADNACTHPADAAEPLEQGGGDAQR